MKANEFFKKVGIKAVKSYIVAYEDHLTDELKRLVESHDLVEKVGGMDKAKMLLRMRIAAELYESADEIEKAIADVESCMEVKSDS